MTFKSLVVLSYTVVTITLAGMALEAVLNVAHVYAAARLAAMTIQ